VQLTNTATGTVTKNYSYDAFGNEKTAITGVNPYRYCGEYNDLETGMYYLRARYYEPKLGRFTQQDTHWTVANMIYGDNPQKINGRQDALGLKTYTCVPQLTAVMQAGNLYVYGVNNPVLYADINGQSVVLTCLLIGLGVGALAGGLIGNKLANENNVTGWGKAGYIGGLALTGGIFGAATGFAIGEIITAISGIAATGLTGTLGGSIGAASYNSWQEAEAAVRDAYHAVKYTFSDLLPGMSNRIVDGYNMMTKTIYEVKFGCASLSQFIKTEIERDSFLIQSGTVDFSEWHFFISMNTGKGGPSAALMQALLDAGIKVIVHPAGG